MGVDPKHMRYLYSIYIVYIYNHPGAKLVLRHKDVGSKVASDVLSRHTWMRTIEAHYRHELLGHYYYLAPNKKLLDSDSPQKKKKHEKHAYK